MAVWRERLSGLSLWWAGLSLQERVLVGVLATLLGLAVLIYGVVKPLQAARADAIADIRGFETLNARGAQLTAADLMELGPDDTVYVRGLIEAAHPAAFEAALHELKKAGGKFNAVVYKNEISRRCVERARADGKAEFARTLEEAFGGITFDVDER